MTDRHGPWVLTVNLAGVVAIAAALVALTWLSWTSQADPHAPRRGPITSISPTAAAPR